MSGLIFVIEQTAVGLYILLSVGILYYWRKWMYARYAYRATTFELERDLARFELNNAMTAVIMLTEVFLVVVGVQQIVAPTVRKDLENVDQQVDELVQVEDGEFVTPTRPAPAGGIPPGLNASGINLGGEDSLIVFVTPTLTPTPVGTIEPNAPAPIGCDTPNATLQIPANGMRVFQSIRVAGTAFVENFSRYKLEIARPGSQFFVLYEGNIPVNETGSFSQFTPIGYEEGTYRFRVMVFDISNELKASCEVTIYISDPIPTATPIQ